MIEVIAGGARKAEDDGGTEVSAPMRDFADRILWVAVADGEKALIFRNMGDDLTPDLRVVRVSEIENPPNRDQGASRPGRMNDGRAGGVRKSSFEQTDFHQLAKSQFAREFAALLEKAAEADRFDKLVVIAPPATLGELRTAYADGLRARLVAEIGKNLTDHPVEDIERAVASALG